ncbi:MAG: mechanosensitive ion channel family protein [Bacteroidia bacterium]|nr:mechanosensitive ion channel family protein [Bacteroidia bacterium]
MKDQLQNTFLEFWNTIIGMIPNIISALLVMLFFFLLGHYTYRLIEKRFSAKWKETVVTALTAGIVKWVLYLIGLIAAVDILGFSGILSSIIAGAGISAIIFGFAFKDIAENFLAGLFLAANRPFKIGNIIEVDGFKGTVKGLDLRTTHIRNVEGKDIYIPNSIIIKNTLVNYTKDGLLRQEFTLGLDIPSDVVQAKVLIMDHLLTFNEILKKPEPNVITSDIGDFTVNIKVLFWVDILKSKLESPAFLGMTVRSKVINDVKDLLLNKGFNLPSPIRELKVYDQPIQLNIQHKDK